MSIFSQILDSTQILAAQMLKKNFKLSTAESCTGGMLSQSITAMQGSSAWFECGFITYSNESKIKLLDVNINALQEEGAVSEVVARQMAAGALSNSTSQISASITGIAGPDGGTKEKPVGTVFIATASKQKNILVNKHLFKGDRQSIREQTTLAAISQLIQQLQE